MRRPAPKSLVRGTLELLLLQALAGGPRHGYAIARALEEDSSDVLSIEEGSMYPALYRLEEQGLVAASWSEDGGRRMRVYTLTTSGRRRLEAQRREWRAFARAVSRLVKVRG